MLRGVVVAFGMLVAVPALAGDMSAEEARRFVIGKMFSYSCFEGTRGAGRIFSDGSVVGTIQIRGDGPVRNAWLPAGTIRVKEERVCASMRGMPFEPCFNLERTSQNAFRGSVSGLGFAYCDFTRHRGRVTFTRAETPQTHAENRHAPLPLRPTLTADRN
ncbi:MAG: hypothetical protein JO205_14485 [Pseudolabrys sp.]|nr:hypothetical protein [Pseudolabrys sp.]MBV9262571.1 hypothetical protein [Pseudolabrys sp.]